MAAAAVLVFTDISAPTLRGACRAVLLTGSSGFIAALGLRRIYGARAAVRITGVFLLVACSTLLSLLAAEFVVRFVYRDITSTGDGSSYFATRWRRSQQHSINRLGFRERDFDSRKKAGLYRIAVVGDSFTYEQGVTDADRLTPILEGLLNRSGGRYEVLNFGRAGAETVDEVEILREAVLPSAPDFILLQWFVNDPEGRDYSRRPRPRSLISFVPLEVWLHRHSALYFLANEQWKKLQRRTGRTASYEEYMTRRFQDPQGPDWRAAEGALLEFFRLARRRSIPVSMILYPRLVDVQGAAQNYPLGFLLDRVKQVCHRENVPCLDLRPVLDKGDLQQALGVVKRYTATLPPLGPEMRWRVFWGSGRDSASGSR